MPVTNREEKCDIMFHGRQPFLKETAVCIVERFLFLSESHACQFFRLLCHIFAKPRFVENHKLCYQREVQTFPLDSSDICDFQG